MPFKAVACDLDGTLLCSDGTLDERSRRALAAVEATGAMVVICTARPARWMRPLAEATGHRGVAICANGGVVWDLHSDHLIEEFPLEPEIARQIVAALEEGLPGGHWAVERSNGFGHEPSYEPRWPVPDDTVIGAVEVLVSQPSVKLMLRHGDLTADELLQRATELVGHLAELSHSNSADCLLEIAAAGVSKASALTRVCAERGIASDEVVAFGDMPNDLPMLRWAGHAVAVANAHADLLAAADEVTTSNDDAGVARVLERLFGAQARPTGEFRQPRMTQVVGLDHVQVAAPEGCEREARRFYGGLLGLPEIDKPEPLRSRGGVWFGVGTQQLHIGVQEPFFPARKAHPALRVRAEELNALALALTEAGAEVIWDEELPDVRRFFSEDPWGNRIELTAAS